MGLCDDTCRTEGCHDDGGDCDEGNKWNATYFCDDIWPVMLDILGPSVAPVMNCSGYVNKYDYSGDDHLNFRELVPLGYDALYDEMFFFAGNSRGPQVNCSECWGMENWNV